jgi:UDP-glucose 4-epimerase
MKGCEAVVHLAGKAIVRESIQNPNKYLLNNFTGTKNVLESMVSNSIKKIVFSSTCAVYGDPKMEFISEECITNPINPYGKSKLLADLEISKFTVKYDFNSISLRFFNVAGSYKSQENKLFGESHANETHLIPRILTQGIIDIYGSDMATPDGTCIRDYVHVVDLARAIKLSLVKINTPGHRIYNLGSGEGSSVIEVIQAAEKVMNKNIIKKNIDKQFGDPEYLVSNPNLAKRELGWVSEMNLTQIIEDSQNFILSQG